LSPCLLLALAAGEELFLRTLDGQLDPSVGQLAKGLVGLYARLDLIDTVSPNKAADLLASMDVEEFAVWPVALRVVWILALASFLPADLILKRNAAWLHRPEGAQLFPNSSDFFFHSL
jgi:hypothetical protein